MKKNAVNPILSPTLVTTSLLALLAIQVSAFGADISASSRSKREASVVKKVVVVLVQFPDVKHNVDRNLMYTRFSQHLNRYVKQVSYNKLSFEFDVTKRWYTMPDPIGRYRISSRNLQVDPTRVGKLMYEALDAADDEVNFSNYSFTVIVLGAKVREYGMIGLCAYPGMFAWKVIRTLKTTRGERVNGGVAIFCYHAHVGTLFHDIAHIIGGIKGGKRAVPCLYDHDLQSKPGGQRETAVASMINMGFWDPMSCHFYKWGQPPPSPSSWTRMRLNWIDRDKIKIVNPRRTTECLLDPLEISSSKTLVIKIPISRSTYYLVENRQPIGCDRVLPGSGVLIMYADDNIAECRHGKAPVKLVNADPSVPNLEGAAFDVGKNSVFVDEKRRIRIEIKEKVGNSYKIVVGPQ